MDDRKGLLVFGRFPQLGRVKTRLMRHLPASAVLQLYRAFLLDTLESAVEGEWQTILYLADPPSPRSRWNAEIQVPESVRIRPQQGNDLGERLWNACCDVQDEFSQVIFIGSDTPDLPLGRLRLAFERLSERPVVIGPVPDGGYYLLGLSEPRQEVFLGIDWGSEHVLHQTSQALSESDFTLLPEWNDVDEIEDLKELGWRLDRGDAAKAPRTLACLETLDLF